MLDTIGKIFKRVICTRLEVYFEKKKTLSGRSTIDAALQVVKTARSAIDGKKFCATVSLNIENALNMMPWHRIIESLQKTGTLKYLVKIVDNCLSDREI